MIDLEEAKAQVRAGIVKFCNEHRGQDLAGMIRMAEATIAVRTADELRGIMADVAKARDSL